MSIKIYLTGAKMIEEILQERRKYIRNVVMSKPQSLSRHWPSLFPVSIWMSLCLSGLVMLWFIDAKIAIMPSTDNLLQIKVLCSAFMIIGIIYAFHLRKSVCYTVTNEYITIEKGTKTMAQIVMFSDIKNISYFSGLLGSIGHFGTLKITRKDGSKLYLFAIPKKVATRIKKLHLQMSTD
jgi:hypothetical protein